MKWLSALGHALLAPVRWLGSGCAALVSGAESFANFLLGVPSRKARNRAETEFLPAALEIVETPPSPIGRLIAVTIMLVFCAALAWAAWARIDVVSTATGRIVPSGSVKVVAPPGRPDAPVELRVKVSGRVGSGSVSARPARRRGRWQALWRRLLHMLTGDRRPTLPAAPS